MLVLKRIWVLWCSTYNSNWKSVLAFLKKWMDKDKKEKRNKSVFYKTCLKSAWIIAFLHYLEDSQHLFSPSTWTLLFLFCYIGLRFFPIPSSAAKYPVRPLYYCHQFFSSFSFKVSIHPFISMFNNYKLVQDIISSSFS